MITYASLAKRIDEMVEVARQAFIELKFPDSEVEDNIRCLYIRINSAKGKRYGEGLIHHLVSAKRQVRNTIKVAILYSPKRKAQIAFWREEYAVRCAESARNNASGQSTLGFFETEYKKQLCIPMTPYKSLFRLTPKSALQCA
jgi:hypothetical protein